MKKAAGYFQDAAVFVGGCLLFGASVNIFITPGGITMGGFTGISTTINSLFSTPVGLFIFLLNLPLLVYETVSGKGRSGVVKALMGIAGTSAATDFMAALPVTYGDRLLCAVFGGLMMGAGSGLLLTRGYTTGGSDLLAYIIRPYTKGLSTGRLILLIDTLIIAGASLIEGSFSGILYSFAAVWCYTTAFDKVLEGMGGAVLAMIVSERHEDISLAISRRLGRGVTLISSSGWYTGKQGQTVFCAVKKNELYMLRSLVRKTDPGAFMIVTGAAEVSGAGFRDG